jgi:hypothetical protein
VSDSLVLFLTGASLCFVCYWLGYYMRDRRDRR